MLLKKKDKPVPGKQVKNKQGKEAARPAAPKKPVKPKKKLTEKQKLLRKRLKMGGGAVAFVIFLIWFGLQPLQGPIQFGVCRAFVELNIQYPKTLRMSLVEVFDKSLRMYISYVDAFGSTRSEMVECDFRPFNMMNLESIKWKGKPVDQEKVEQFNKTIIAILAANPDLVIPAAPKGDLMELKRDNY